jgi:hypothetical protein
MSGDQLTVGAVLNCYSAVLNCCSSVLNCCIKSRIEKTRLRLGLTRLDSTQLDANGSYFFSSNQKSTTTNQTNMSDSLADGVKAEMQPSSFSVDIIEEALMLPDGCHVRHRCEFRHYRNVLAALNPLIVVDKRDHIYCAGCHGGCRMNTGGYVCESEACDCKVPAIETAITIARDFLDLKNAKNATLKYLILTMKIPICWFGSAPSNGYKGETTKIAGNIHRTFCKPPNAQWFHFVVNQIGVKNTKTFRVDVQHLLRHLPNSNHASELVPPPAQKRACLDSSGLESTVAEQKLQDCMLCREEKTTICQLNCGCDNGYLCMTCLHRAKSVRPNDQGSTDIFNLFLQIEDPKMHCPYCTKEATHYTTEGEDSIPIDPYGLFLYKRPIRSDELEEMRPTFLAEVGPLLTEKMVLHDAFVGKQFMLDQHLLRYNQLLKKAETVKLSEPESAFVESFPVTEQDITNAVAAA